MTPDPDAVEDSADDAVEDLEATDPEADDVTGGNAGKGGSIVVMDPTNARKP